MRGQREYLKAIVLAVSEFSKERMRRAVWRVATTGVPKRCRISSWHLIRDYGDSAVYRFLWGPISLSLLGDVAVTVTSATAAPASIGTDSPMSMDWSSSSTDPSALKASSTVMTAASMYLPSTISSTMATSSIQGTAFGPNFSSRRRVSSLVRLVEVMACSPAACG